MTKSKKKFYVDSMGDHTWIIEEGTEKYVCEMVDADSCDLFFTNPKYRRLLAQIMCDALNKKSK